MPGGCCRGRASSPSRCIFSRRSIRRKRATASSSPRSPMRKSWRRSRLLKPRRIAYRRAMNKPAPKTFQIKSFGCQMNVYEGARMAELLEAEGLTAAGGESADLVVLNTCHIREKAAEKVYSEIGRLKREDGSRPMIAVAGCVAQAEGAEIPRRAPSVDVVVGPQAYHRLQIGRASCRERGWIAVSDGS